MDTKWRVLRLLLVLTGLFRVADAQTIFVETSNDVVDFGGAQRVADLPGPDGLVSLPEAGLASDNTAGVQTIGFHIPQSDWQYQQFFPGRAVLRPFLGFRVFDTAILDARTQTAFTGETNPEGGGEVVIWQETYLIDNVGGAVFGFDNSSLHLSGGSNNVIQANTKTGVEIYDSGFNLIGGTNPGQGNTGGFIQIDRASNNVVVGNTANRVRVLGWIANGQAATNNRIGGPTPAERNHILGLGTVDEHGYPSGFGIQLFDAIGTRIENNWIGMSPDGLSQGNPYTTSGIYFDTENYDTTIRDNRIAGILAWVLPPHGQAYRTGNAITLYGAGSGVSIVGNKIGLNANDEPLLGSVVGISSVHFFYPNGIANVVIGGSAPGEGNEIAGQLDSGISVANTYSGMRISGNSIHDNGGLGIDLITADFLAGVTPNDPLDPDTGGNGLQNFPVLQSATAAGAGLRVVGALDSSASSSFTIEFFASPGCDPSGFGEGWTFLGSTNVSTNASGGASFDVLLPATAPSGWAVTATAMLEPTGSTSEFSACVPISGSVGTSFCFGDGTSGACPCGNSGSPGHGCQNSGGTGGSILSSSGTASLSADSLVHTASGERPTALSIVLQGDTAIAPANFGDGLRCAGGVLKRLYVKNASGGVVTAPQMGDPSVSARSAAAGDPIPIGATRNYQIYYRDANAGFCPDPPGSTFNASNAVAILWGS